MLRVEERLAVGCGKGMLTVSWLEVADSRCLEATFVVAVVDVDAGSSASLPARAADKTD